MPCYAYGIAWSNELDLYVTVGSCDTGQARTILTSPNGADWELQSVKDGGHLKDVAWGNSKFIAVGYDGTVLTSKDGSDWTEQSLGISTHFGKIIWANSKFVMLPLQGIIHETCPQTSVKPYTTMPWASRYGDIEGSDRCEGTGGHPGVDIDSNSNFDVCAIGKSQVIEAHEDVDTGWGKYIVLSHDNVTYPDCTDCPKSVYSIYAHLDSLDESVVKDAIIAHGQQIGIMGNTTSPGSMGVHLHFQVQESWGGSPYWYPGYPTGKCENQDQYCDVEDWSEEERQEAANQVMQNTINPMLLVEEGNYIE
ncbi:MAG: M23 family metallopeptidase [Methanosarcinales archaeon]|nr:M23 family metallopeptidase [Methanosarcinales archaeon]